MNKLKIKIFLTIIIICSIFNVCLAYNNPSLGVKSISTFYLNDIFTKISSSSLIYDFPINQSFGGEFIYQSFGSAYLLDAFTTQISLRAKNNLLNWGRIYVMDCWGLSYISERGVGSSTALDIGVIPVINLSSQTYISMPIVVSLFSDGKIANIFLGITHKANFLRISEFVFGAKVIGVIVESPKSLITQWTFGLRFDLAK